MHKQLVRLFYQGEEVSALYYSKDQVCNCFQFVSLSKLIKISSLHIPLKTYNSYFDTIDGQLTLIQQPTTISSPGNSILSSGSSNAVSVANRSSPVQQTTTNNTLTSLPFFNLTTSMQPTKPLGSKICRWVQVCSTTYTK